MKRLIDRKTLKEFYKKHPDSKDPLLAWHEKISDGSFKSLVELQSVFPKAEQVGKATVFDIKGNTYQLITAIHYNTQVVYILKVMTHAEYSKNKWQTEFQVFTKA